ncbi:aminomethyl transferase family protein [Rhizobium pusense]|uniref:aminomethyltransferase family protein n=1 Tax=Agrobacterium pusense TaxID=648995 RepID=UPI000D19ED61|nr:aminomethyltransferase family protein [Agrobacterium pusense]MDH0910490.1 aminomethyl transferase family protein [Agrobacterium pusense]MDH1098343.1 aminomethyl transferase family protein [Agrobacterium pusense]MDH1114505.1 aminomethyl transferase family protein [Agrobacterium pusense]MDH2195731.1 aminomethyl transferase family protein [Agrobacterium pusense]
MNMHDLRRTPPGYFTSRWGLPEYTNWQDESLSWKETCYIGDWSFLWERRFKGPDVMRLLSDVSVNSFEKFAINQSKHVIHTTEAGKIIAEGIATRLGDDEVMLFGRGTFWVDYKLRHGNYKVISKPDDWFNFQVSGPNAIHVVEKACGQNLRDIKFMHNGRIKIAGHDVLALRQGMAGEIGYELQGDSAYSQDVYQAILEAGKDHGIRQLGGRTAFINHLEACFPTIVTDYLPAIFGDEMKEYLAEFRAAMPAFASTFNVAGSFESDDISDWYRGPIELGWGKRITLDHDFIGREALEAELANPKRTIRTLVWNAEDIADVHASLFSDGTPYDFMEMPRDQRGFMYADKVLRNGQLVGVSTSRGYSFSFRKMLSLCTIDIEHSEPGAEVTVVWGNPGHPQKHIRAIVAPAPYKQDNRRADVAKI